MDAMAIGAAIGSVVGGIVQANGAKKAAQAQANSASEDRAFQLQMYDQTRADLAPYRDGGQNYLAALNYDMGLTSQAPVIGGNALSVQQGWTGDPNERGSGATPYWTVNGQRFDSQDQANAFASANSTGGTTYGGFTGSPGYQFQLNQGMNAIDASAAARGMLRSGGTMQAQQEYGTGLAAQDYGNHIARLFAGATMGQQASAQQVAANQNLAAGASNTFAAQGNAQAAGYVGAANAFNGTVNNLTGLWGYQQAQGNTGSGGGWW